MKEKKQKSKKRVKKANRNGKTTKGVERKRT